MRDLRKFRVHVEILKHNHPELVVQLVSEPKDNPVDISETADGIVLRWSGKTLHSVKSPEHEAARLLDQFQFENGRAYIVFGMGLGHLADLSRRRLPDRAALILVEPDIRILRESLGCSDLRALLYDPRVHWVSGKDWVEYLRIILRRVDGSGCRPSSTVLSLPAYRTYFKKALGETYSVLAQFLNELDIDSTTRQELWHLWNQNLTANLSQILTSAPVRNFTTTFQNIPAILIGAGPSLDDNLPDLNRLKEHALLIVVDTALAPVLAAGCEPDLVLAMDAQEENARDFRDLPPHRTTLMFDAFCYPSIPSLYPPEFRIATMTGHIFSEIDETVTVKNGLLPMLEHVLDYEYGFLQNGGSVITGGFDLLRLAGCSAIGLLGVDLAYSSYQTHSQLINRLRPRMTTSMKYLTPESLFFDDLAGKSKLRLESMSGGQVWSDRVMLMYKHWMEDGALKTGIPCFSLGICRGAKMQGYPPISIDEFISRHGAARSEIDARLTRCRTVRPDFKIADSKSRLADLRRDLAALDEDPSADHVGPFDLETFVQMASFEVSQRLRAVLSIEPDPEHLKRRQQAARSARQFVIPFLDRLESVLNQMSGT